MLMKKWNELPKEFQTSEIKQYYDILAKRTAALIIKRSFDIIMSLLLFAYFITGISCNCRND